MRVKVRTKIGLILTGCFVVIELLRYLFRAPSLGYLATIVVSLMLVFVLIAFVPRVRLEVGGRPTQTGLALKYAGFSGLGATFVAFLSIPVGAMILFLAAPLLILNDAGFVFSLVVLLAATLWALFGLRSFASFHLEPTRSGLITYWPHLGRTSFAPWSNVKLFHLVGPVFAVGVPWLFPITWLIVRRHAFFLKDVGDHLSQRRQQDKGQ